MGWGAGNGKFFPDRRSNYPSSVTSAVENANDERNPIGSTSENVVPCPSSDTKVNGRSEEVETPLQEVMGTDSE
ncbi:MAG: hypothetical protein Q7R81_03130 [Candidatus Peregrinibacteria bacterium]|nr:hypothetical protein [Candidatus Peregrinibacteria bacterium]